MKNKEHASQLKHAIGNKLLKGGVRNANEQYKQKDAGTGKYVICIHQPSTRWNKKANMNCKPEACYKSYLQMI